MWRRIWLLYCIFIDRLIANTSESAEMELENFKDISAISGRKFLPFKLEDSEENEVDRTTTDMPPIALKDWMDQNPSLRNLAMFQGADEIDNGFSLNVLPLEEFEKPGRTDDNFHRMYTEMNGTLFTQTDKPNDDEAALIALSSPRRRMPTGRILSDRNNPPEIQESEIDNFFEPSTTTEAIPFTVTEDIVRDLTHIGKFAFDTAPTPVPNPTLPDEFLTTPEDITVTTARPSFYRIPESFEESEVKRNQINGERVHSIEMVNSNGISEDEDQPFLGDSTTFEIPTARPEWTTEPQPTWSPAQLAFSLTPAPYLRDQTPTTLNYFSGHHRYFATTAPSVDLTLDDYSTELPREELVLFNAPDQGEESSERLPTTTTPTLLPRRTEKSKSSGGNSRGRKRKTKKTKKKVINTSDLSVPMNSQSAADFDLLTDRQLQLDLEKDLRELKRDHLQERADLSTKRVEFRKKKKLPSTTTPVATTEDSRRKTTGISRSYEKNGREEMENDPKFAMEIEILRTKKLREEINRRLPRKNDKRKLHRKYGRSSSGLGSKRKNKLAPLSRARMISRGDRMVEERISMIGGQKVTVDLANPALHGADLMMAPGAVIHDLLDANPSKTDERREINGDINMKSREEERRPGFNDYENPRIFISEFADDRVSNDIDESSRMEIETFDGSQFDRPSKCCDKEIKDQEGNKKHRADTESLENLLVPLNSDHSRRTQTNSLYSETNAALTQLNETEQDRFIIDRCFIEKRNCYLIDASPMERRIVTSPIECLRFCARVKGCLSVSFASTLSICDIYNIRNGTGPANLVQLLGYMYYEPKVTEMDKCMSATRPTKQRGSNNIRRAQAKFPKKINASPVIDPMISINLRRATYNLSMADTARCKTNQKVLFVRSRGIRDSGGNNLDTVLNINEDDCVFSCISNLAGYYDIFDCLSAQYDSYDEACTLSSDRPREESLSLHASSNFYEKICTKPTVASRCSGGTVERKRQKVLSGLLRDSITVGGPLECIERCVDVDFRLPFKCLSVLYYYEESTFNCVLNDGSALTHPNSLFDETTSIVDYFGIDECHGIKEIRHVINPSRGELRSNFVHEGGVVHKRAERPLPFYERARI